MSFNNNIKFNKEEKLLLEIKRVFTMIVIVFTLFSMDFQSNK